MKRAGPSLFDVAAERVAYEEAMQGGSRPLSQVRTELVHGRTEAIAQTCAQCGCTFIAKPRDPAKCNLCRAGYEFCKVCGMMLPLHSKVCPQYKKARS